MPVRIDVMLEELPEGSQKYTLYRETWDVTLRSLVNDCLAELQRRLPADKVADDLSDSRHFWWNRQFQAYGREDLDPKSPFFGLRRLGDIQHSDHFTLHFRKDSYLASAPQQRDWHCVLDPERTVQETLEIWRKANRIADVCCYELRAQGKVLEDKKSLWEQGVCPYTTPQEKEKAHLSVRYTRSVRWQVGVVLFLCAVLGFTLGWVLRRGL